MWRNNSSWVIGMVVVGVFALVLPAAAYTAHRVVSDIPYEVIAVEEEFSREHWYLGTLLQFPDLYEFFVPEPAMVTLSLRVPALVSLTEMRPALLVVRDVAPRGVEEVVRVEFDETEWVVVSDPLSRLSYVAPPALMLDLTPGVYRVEVSTPNNEGKYMLVFGTNLIRPSWRESLATVRALYDFYEVPGLQLLRSPVVHYPLGVVVGIGLMVVTWRYRRNLVSLRR